MGMKVRFPLGTASLLAASFVAGSAGAAEPIHFEVRNNGDLVKLCSAKPDEPNYLAAIHFCHGFGVGFVRYHEALREGKDFRPLFCLPTGITRNQVLEEYVRYSTSHPEYDPEAVVNVLAKFLNETYPCPTEAQPKTAPVTPKRRK